MSKSNGKKPEIDPALHFLHDLLNHTHGLKLYLESCDNGIDKSVKELIYSEVQALEDQIANQFDNMVKIEEYDVSQVIDKCLEQLDLYHLNYDYCPVIDGDSMDLILDQSLEIEVDLFNRLIKNIAKNIYLWSDRDHDVEVRVEFFAQVMSITFRNKISKDVDAGTISNGIGLRSMQKLASQMNMSFNTNLDGDWWTTSMQIKIVGYGQQKLAS